MESNIILATITFLAVIVALFGEKFWEWKNRPKIKFALGNVNPYVFQSYEQGVILKYLRLKIINNGKTPIKNCKVKIASVIIEDSDIKGSIITPTILRWSDAPFDMRYRYSSFFSMDINQLIPLHKETIDISQEGGWEFFDLLNISTSNNMMILSSAGESIPPIKENVIFTIEASGENVKPKTAKLRIKNHNNFQNIEMEWVKSF